MPDLASWNPTRQTREDFEANARAGFDLVLKNYCETIESQAAGTGLKRTPKKRSREHFYWLARFQVRGDKPAQIWRFHPVQHRGSQRAVEKAIKELAKFIGLTLR